MSAVPQLAQPALSHVAGVREPLRAPFPYFGGKSRVAHLVWDRFGAGVRNYVEPFAGSLAILLARPDAPQIETVNDLDCYIANFWRALQCDPYGVAAFADGPVNEADLHARHLWLVNAREWRERMKTDPDHYDVKIAGWWVWGISQWIGSGWCYDGRLRPNLRRTIPHLTGDTGVHAAQGSKGVHRKRPHLTGNGEGAGVHGVHRKLPNVADGGLRGTLAPGRSDALIGWMVELADRLRGVRVCCGDWRRVCTPAVTFGRGACAVFLDPPYAAEDRDALYNQESFDVAHDVREWALEAGRNPDCLIALCGYDEHVMPGWTPVAWKTGGGYGNQSAGRGRANALRETIWFSPACAAPQGELF